MLAGQSPQNSQERCLSGTQRRAVWYRKPAVQPVTVFTGFFEFHCCVFQVRNFGAICSICNKNNTKLLFYIFFILRRHTPEFQHCPDTKVFFRYFNMRFFCSSCTRVHIYASVCIVWRLVWGLTLSWHINTFCAHLSFRGCRIFWRRPAVKQQQTLAFLGSYHIHHILRIWPHQIMAFVIMKDALAAAQWRRVSQWVAADYPTTTTSKEVSASRCVLSRKTGLPHPPWSCQKDGNGAMTSVGSMWSVLKCDCGCHQHLSACIPGEFESSLNDLRIKMFLK
jgi:hypothetical protein